MVKTWNRNFKFGRTTLYDLPRSGRPIDITTNENVSAVRDLVNENPTITLLQMADILGISGEKIQHIIHSYLKVG